MKYSRSNTLALTAASILFTIDATADTSMWKISRGGNHLLIGGTVHVLGKSDYPLPAEFDKAFDEAEQIILETDIEAMQSADFQQKVAAHLTYTDGTTLKSALQPDTFDALNDYLVSRSFPIENMATFRPGLVMATMAILELSAIGYTSDGVDAHFSQRARQEQKILGQLETADEQLGFLASLGKDDPDQFVNYLLKEINKLEAIFKELKSAWRTGDMNKMAALSVEPMKTEYPSIYQTLLLKRNNTWVPIIEGMIKTGEVELILVGAAHLAGEDSVLKQLDTLGYTIERY